MVDPELQRRLQEELRTVERDENGIIVLSRYGFKIAEIEGKKYVVCQTEAEYRANLPSNVAFGNCLTKSGGGVNPCIQQDCNASCEYRFLLDTKSWHCICV